MQNVYTQSSILSEKEFKEIEKIFDKIWGKDTTFELVQDEWTEDNKAYGQCLVTAAIIYDLFGGRLIYDKENSHYWNELSDGTWQDFSRSQFKNGRKFSIYKYKTKNEALFDETGIKKHTPERYTLLKKRFEKLYKA